MRHIPLHTEQSLICVRWLALLESGRLGIASTLHCAIPYHTIHTAYATTVPSQPPIPISLPSLPPNCSLGELALPASICKVSKQSAGTDHSNFHASSLLRSSTSTSSHVGSPKRVETNKHCPSDHHPRRSAIGHDWKLFNLPLLLFCADPDWFGEIYSSPLRNGSHKREQPGLAAPIRALLCRLH